MAGERLIPRDVGVVVAVSGGLDSMVLLDLLARVAVEYGWRLVVAHLNHRLRGRASRADSSFVQRAARAYGLDCVMGKAEVRLLARRGRISVEMAARRARHEFLARTARQTRAHCVVLAHHADDQVELFFLRVLRGTALEGLGGMECMAVSPVDPEVRLVRPLLNTSRQDLRAYAEARGLRWREDASNADLEVPRNRLRHKLLPKIARDYQPALTEVVPRLMANARIEHDYVRTQAEEAMRRGDVVFERLHPALQRELMRRELARLGVTMTTGLIDRLCETPPVPVVAPGEDLLVRNGMRIERATHEAPREGWNVAPNCVVALRRKRGRIDYGGRLFVWSHELAPQGRADRWATLGAGPGVEWFDADRIGDTIALRHWRPGDRFQPIGMENAVKLQDLFVNQGIDRVRRHALVVAEAADGGLFWVEGLRISERYRLDNGTQHLLKWQWRLVAASAAALARGPGRHRVG